MSSVPKRPAAALKRSKSQRDAPNFRRAVYRVVRAHGDGTLRVRQGALQAINRLAHQFVSQLLAEETTLRQLNSHKTLSARDVRSAVTIVVGDMAEQPELAAAMVQHMDAAVAAEHAFTKKTADH